MAFTPEEIEQKEFLNGLRGYEKEEVRAFLEAVATDQKRLTEELARLKSRSTDPMEMVGQEVGAVLKSAQDTAALLETKARKESEALVSQAQQRAEQMLSEAQERVSSMTSKASQQAESVRSKAEAYATSKREEADSYAAATRRTADEYSAGVRSNAEREASKQIADAKEKADQRLREAAARVQKLRSVETELRERLDSIGEVISGARQTLDGSSGEQASGNGVAAEPAAAAAETIKL